MSRDNSNNLPSYKDFLEKSDDDLPSLEEVLEENLPSVDDFLPKSVEEETQTIENSDGEAFLEVSDVVAAPEWSELVRLVNDVRKDIPEIPEIKSYDDELEQLGVQITQIQTNFSLLDAKSDKITDLSAQNEEFEVKLTEIESKIPEVPEVRYYEGDIELIYGKISRIKEEIESLPEVKYYEKDLETLKSRIEEVNEAIPTFPDWVQEVQEVPDFSWIGKTFSLIDDDFNKVQGHLDIIREKIDYQVNELNDTVEKKEFDLKVDINNLNNSLNDTNIYLGETKDKIYKEIKDSSVRIWEHHKEFKDDDRKLKKAILSEQNKLKQSLQKEIKDINEKSVKADESILKFFTDLKETVDTLPEVKYYDRDISKLRKDLDTTKEDLDITKDDIKDLVSELNQIATTIKEQQELISEGYLLNEPPEEKQTAGNQTDPLTPLDQKFATLKDLSAHYRLFVNRIQTQLAAIGGGGAGFIRDLDDVNFDATAGNGQLLIWDSPNSRWVGIDSNKVGRVGAAGTWTVGDVGIHTTKSVGIGTTARSGFTLYVEGDQYVDGNITVGGTVTYEDVKNVDSLGIITGRDNINIVTDGKKLQIGADADLQLYHDSGQSFIDNNTGPLYIRNNVDDDDGGNIIIEAKSGKASAVFQDDEGVRLYYDNAEKFETTVDGINITGNIESDSLNVSGVSTFVGDVSFGSTVTFGDDLTINMGDGPDLKLYHDSSNSYVEDTGTGALILKGSTIRFRSTTNENMVSASQNGAVNLYYNNSKKFETTDSGINVSGATTTTTLEVTSYSTFNGNVKLFDGKYLNLGNGNDLQIVHDGGNAVIQNATGAFFIDNNSTGGDIFLRANDNVVIRVDGNDTVLTAQTGGIDVTGHTETDTLNVSGIVTAASYYGDGSNLTGILGGVGIQSGSARIGVGFTDINFTGAGVTVVGSGSTVVIDIPATTIRRQVETSSGVTTEFTITDGYTSGFIDVYLNGVKQRDGTDFTASNETSVIMVPPVSDGDVLEFQIYENLTVASGGGGESYTGTSGQILQHNGSKYVGVSSVGLATFFNDHHQGYYRYSTHYYSSGIANTVQTLPSDEFVLIQPSVRTNRFEYLPEKMLDANSNNPWVGTAATIGTGQTEFSLAGLDEGSTVIVRIASQFNPDIDYTNVDFSLNFTTNPTTQSFGTTSFSIVREQGLICNEGADQNYLSETLINFYVGSSLSGLTTADAGTFNMSVRASEGGEFEMLALTVNVVA